MLINQRVAVRIGAADCGPRGMTGGAIMRLFRAEERRFRESEAGTAWRPVAGGEVIEVKRRPAVGAEVIVTTVVDGIGDEGAQLVQTLVVAGSVAARQWVPLVRRRMQR
ncbi:hypothetical protein [Chitinimonas lacunae]|uniref:Uncharacterized protein n=1 Tax=Chitinimonas lacunae TaxID=1963018 RepID=A0ABV8MMH0_9NEIS